MSTIDSGLGWSCDSDFLFSEAQTLVTFPNGNIIKKNPGAAIVAAWHNNGSPVSYGVTMISPDSSTFAELETDSNNIHVGTVTSEVHDGVTWYECDAWNQTPTYAQNESYHTEKLPLLNTSLGHSGAPNAVLTIINESRFEFTAKKIPTTDYVKAFVEGVEAETAERVNAAYDMIAPAFSTSENYSADDIVIYGGKLYKCVSAHSAGAWVSADFSETSLAELIKERRK